MSKILFGTQKLRMIDIFCHTNVNSRMKVKVRYVQKICEKCRIGIAHLKSVVVIVAQILKRSRDALVKLKGVCLFPGADNVIGLVHVVSMIN